MLYASFFWVSFYRSNSAKKTARVPTSDAGSHWYSIIMTTCSAYGSRMSHKTYQCGLWTNNHNTIKGKACLCVKLQKNMLSRKTRGGGGGGICNKERWWGGRGGGKAGIATGACITSEGRLSPHSRLDYKLTTTRVGECWELVLWEGGGDDTPPTSLSLVKQSH